jgi:hypothetical protein
MKNPQTDQDQSRGKSSGANGSAEERPSPSLWYLGERRQSVHLAGEIGPHVALAATQMLEGLLL